jgi:hypothetical protein
MPRSRTDITDSIADAIDWLKFTKSVFDAQRKRENEDLEFQTAEGAWPDDVSRQRAAQPPSGKLPALPARPMLSVASIDEPIALVAAEERKAHLGVTIHPLSEEATDDTAQVLQGLYRSIETDSHASNVRSWSYQRSLWAGWGVYRVSKQFDPYGGHPFDQKIVLERILFQANVFLDPFARKPDWSDMRRAMVVDDLPWPIYKEKYPKSQVAKYGMTGLEDISAEYPEWANRGDKDDETATVRIVEEWRIEVTELRHLLLDDGSTAREDHIPEGRMAVEGDEARYAIEEVRRVFWRVINAREELEPEQEWDGQYIPLIATIGRELQPVKGKRQWLGMVSNAKDAVRLTNYAASGAIEMAALEPRAPFELDPEQIEGYEAWWDQSNLRNFPYLPVHRFVRGQPVEPPQRVQADVSRMGPSMQLLGMGRQFVQAATAIYPPALGENTPAHRSGRAITALQDQSLQANTPYLDNLASVSMPYEATVVLDLIPHVYDRPGRVARILDDQNRSQQVVLNAPFTPDPATGRPRALPTGTPDEQSLASRMVNDPNNPAKQYDLSKGRYGVSVTIGQGKSSRMQAGNDAISQLMQADPALVPVLGPEWAKFQDFPGSDTIAKLLTKMRDHMMPWLSDQPMAAAMDPQKLMAENQQLKQQLGLAGQTLQTKQIEQQGKLQVTRMQEDAETQRAREANETKITVAALGSKVESLSNLMQLFMEERGRLGSQAHEATQSALDRTQEGQMAGGDALQAALQRRHDATMASGQQQATMQQAVPPGAPAGGPPVPPTGPGEGNGQPPLG